MFEWLPEVCREIHGNLVEVYWLLLVPYVLFMICLELFKIPDANPGAGKILKRAVISMLLLFSFEECMNIIAMISDGITEKISGIVQLKDLLKHMAESYQERELSWLKAREAIIYLISLLSYIVAYLGVFTADVLIHFVWSILYVVSPLMILMYVSEKTAFVTGNLYKGLINVVTWKVFWSVLAVMLLKLAMSPQVVESDNFIVAVLMNLCIGFSMLFVPFATKSLISDGMGSAASALATLPTAAAFGAVKLYAAKAGKKGISEVFSGFKGTRQFTANRYRDAKAGVQFGKEMTKRSHERATQVLQKAQRLGTTDHPKPIPPPFVHQAQSPFGPKGPFGKGRNRILQGKE